MFLTFSETVNRDTLNESRIILHSMMDRSLGDSYTLSGGLVITNNAPLQVYQLSFDDANLIRNFSNLVVSPETTFLTVLEDAVRDMNDNPIIGESGLEVNENFVNDFVRPNLTDFHLDLNTGLLILTFTETVDASSINATQFTFLSAPGPNSTQYTLTGGYVVTFNCPTVTFQLSELDINNIKALSDLATDALNTFLSITKDAISDMNGNPVRDIPETEPLPTDQYTPDIRPPRLIGFGYDANKGSISLNFTETVNVDTLDFTALTLQADPSGPLPNRSYTLTGGEVLSGNSTMVMIELSVVDFNNIKRLPALGTMESNTYLTQEGLLKDTSGNEIVAILPPMFLAASFVIPDESDPSLEYFDIDLNQGSLTLVFDETVDISSLALDKIYLVSANVSLEEALDNENITVFSPTASSSPSPSGTNILIEFSFEDLNRLKILPLCVYNLNGRHYPTKACIIHRIQLSQ